MKEIDLGNGKSFNFKNLDKKMNEILIQFIQIYSQYYFSQEKKVLDEISKKEFKKTFNAYASYICTKCGNRTTAPFIEKKHSCLDPMFDKEGFPNRDYMIRFIVQETGRNLEDINLDTVGYDKKRHEECLKKWKKQNE